MGDESATYYKALFLSQGEKWKQTKKAISRRWKSSGAGPSSAKRGKKDAPLLPSKIPEEAHEEPDAAVAPPIEVAVYAPSRSPTSSAALLDALVEVPSTEERARAKARKSLPRGSGTPTMKLPRCRQVCFLDKL